MREQRCSDDNALKRGKSQNELWRRQSGSYDHTFKNRRIQGCRDHVVGVSDWYVVPHGGGESDCHRPVSASAAATEPHQYEH